ncbi:unnamed protein product, partial [Closterium sp. NIES-53]
CFAFTVWPCDPLFSPTLPMGGRVFQQHTHSFPFCVAGNMKKPPAEQVLLWVAKAWDSIPEALIAQSFKTCGLSNALDGSEDHLCLRHLTEGSEVEISDEVDPTGWAGENGTMSRPPPHTEATMEDEEVLEGEVAEEDPDEGVEYWFAGEDENDDAAAYDPFGDGEECSV